MISNAHALWRKHHWYFSRAQPEMSHLRVHLECDFGPAKADEAMALSMEQAVRDPEKHDLLRVRMGGLSEFFVTMFPAYQAQQQRRPIETPELAPSK